MRSLMPMLSKLTPQSKDKPKPHRPWVKLMPGKLAAGWLGPLEAPNTLPFYNHLSDRGVSAGVDRYCDMGA